MHCAHKAHSDWWKTCDFSQSNDKLYQVSHDHRSYENKLYYAVMKINYIMQL